VICGISLLSFFYKIWKRRNEQQLPNDSLPEPIHRAMNKYLRHTTPPSKGKKKE